MLARLRAVAVSAEGAMLSGPSRIFLFGWVLVVSGVGMRSWSWALVVGGSLLIGVVVLGALKR